MKKMLNYADFVMKGSKEFRDLFVKSDKKWWMNTYSDFGKDIGKIYDWQVGDYVKKHLRFADRFNIRKITAAALTAHAILSNSCETPSDDNWKF